MFTTEVRVRYADTDAMGVVYHANYLVWFEVGRVELMRHWGIPYKQFEEMGIFVPVVESTIRWIYPARYDDLLRIEPRVAELSPAKVKFAYRIVRAEDDRLLCEGYTLHGFLDAKAGRPVALSRHAPGLFASLKALAGDQPQAPVPT